MSDRRRQSDVHKRVLPRTVTEIGSHRDAIDLGAEVLVILKNDQATGHKTRGKVARLLTNSAYHPHGIKVMLTSGEVGRVSQIIDISRGDKSCQGHEQLTSAAFSNELGPPKSSLLSAWIPDVKSEPVSTSIRVADDKVALLVSMGFDDSMLATEVLVRCNNNVEAALDELLARAA